MTQNIPGLNNINQINKLHEYELPDGDDVENMIIENPPKDKEDENTYLDTDFDDMSLEDITNLTRELENELLGLKTEIENLEEIIKANNELKQNYEKQCEAVKQQIEKARKDLNNAKTPQDKEQAKKRISSLKQNLQALTSEIKMMIGTIQAYNEMKSDTRSEYLDTNRNYQKASLSQTSKEMAQKTSVSSENNTSTVQNSSSTNNTTINKTNHTDRPSTPKGNSSGKVSNNMINALKNWEGLRTTAYKCPSGVWTIGYGHTGGVSSGQTISEAQAEQYLRDDLASFENEVNSMAKSAGVKLTQGQFDALTSFAYNCGGGALQKSGILGMIKEGHIDAAANKMKEYVHGGGKVLPGLVSRRDVEAGWLYS